MEVAFLVVCSIEQLHEQKYKIFQCNNSKIIIEIF